MSFWFRHDSNAYFNERILKLRAKFGNEGYGGYWIIMEALYNNNGYLDADAMQWLCRCNAVADDILKLCVDLGLLKFTDNKYSSERLLREISNRNKNSEIASKKATIRWENEKAKKSTAAAMREEKTREEKTTVVFEKSLTRWLQQQGKGEGYDHWLVENFGDVIERAWKKVLAGHKVKGAADFVELCKTISNK